MHCSFLFFYVVFKILEEQIVTPSLSLMNGTAGFVASFLRVLEGDESRMLMCCILLNQDLVFGVA